MTSQSNMTNVLLSHHLVDDLSYGKVGDDCLCGCWEDSQITKRYFRCELPALNDGAPSEAPKDNHKAKVVDYDEYVPTMDALQVELFPPLKKDNDSSHSSGTAATTTTASMSESERSFSTDSFEVDGDDDDDDDDNNNVTASSPIGASFSSRDIGRYPSLFVDKTDDFESPFCNHTVAGFPERRRLRQAPQQLSYTLHVLAKDQRNFKDGSGGPFDFHLQVDGDSSYMNLKNDEVKESLFPLLHSVPPARVQVHLDWNDMTLAGTSEEILDLVDDVIANPLSFWSHDDGHGA